MQIVVRHDLPTSHVQLQRLLSAVACSRSLYIQVGMLLNKEALLMTLIRAGKTVGQLQAKAVREPQYYWASQG